MATLESQNLQTRELQAVSVSRGVRGYVQNLALLDSSGDVDRATSTFLFRPTSVSESIAVTYSKTAVLGMSHSYQGYSNTENVRWDFVLYANAMMVKTEGVTQAVKERASRRNDSTRRSQGAQTELQALASVLEESRRFLEALCYPASTTAGVIGAEPPACILSIPGIVTQRVRLVSLGFEHSRCDKDGNVVEWSARTSWEEAPLTRILMDDVLANGSFRTWG